MRGIALLIAMLVSTAAFAAEEQYITGVNTKKLYVYDDAGEEIDEIKADVVKKAFAPVTAGGKELKGLQIEELDADEGLVKVELAGFETPVWLETMALDIWPDNRLKCPEATLGRSEVEQSGMTIGFGEHCQDDSVDTD